MDVAEEVYDLARKYLYKVRRSGPYDIMAICPFHRKEDGSEERTPSFAMSLVKGVYFCHACHSKGNLFTFLRDIGVGRTVIETEYRFLLDEAAKNIPPPPDPVNPKVYELSPINEAVLGILDYCPTDLLEAGFSMQTLHHFEVGYDRWHLRMTFPLRDIKGQLIGISGRAPDGMEPRYKVYTKEYERWDLPPAREPDRGSILYNADKVFPGVYFTSPTGHIVAVVEGFKACMWLWQAGIRNVVALLGTYLSWEHKWILEHLGAPVYLFLDNNSPGRSGTIQAAEELSQALPVHVVNYPDRLVDYEAAQPDDCTPEEVTEGIASAPTYLNWLIRQAPEAYEVETVGNSE
jgi:DNA primase